MIQLVRTSFDDSSVVLSENEQVQQVNSDVIIEPLATSGVIADVPATTPLLITPFATSETVADPLNDSSMRATTLESGDRVNILLLGTDGREQEFGPPRTDLMMLIILDRNPQRVTIISIPRDLWVPIYGHGEGKINTAYFLGSITNQGTELARRTVEDLVDMPIHHTVEIDFNGFRTLIDEMGGLTVHVPEAIDDAYYPDENYGTLHLQIPAGEQLMDGELALRYARTRHGGTDQSRSARQQIIIMAMRERALTPSQLAKAPLHLRTVYNVVESDLSLGDYFALARFARTLTREQISMHTISGDLSWSVMTWNGLDALLYDPEELKKAIADWSRPKKTQK
ncbi:MAG: LCP family protein [Ardenticatenaceae bacterium]